MLMRIRKVFDSMRSDEDGFTLMELLVAMVAGVAVTGALFGVLEVSLHQTARLTDRVQATQLGRVAMTRVIDALHSTCISPEFRPVQEKSNGSELVFVNAYSSKAIIPTSEVSKHKIFWNKETGTLTDYSYPATEGAWPKYTFSGTASPASGTRIASNVAEAEEKGEKIPIFQYFKYATTSESSALTPLSTIYPTRLTVPLSAKEAETVASVLVRFTALPSDGNTALNRGVEMRNQVTLAMSAPSSETPIEASPCE
jgi:prepilin-type N-terminal cleavage/methylation domain-containing protein